VLGLRRRQTARRRSNVLGFRPLVKAFEPRQLLSGGSNFLQGIATDTNNAHWRG
jgi:hypothetical protein